MIVWREKFVATGIHFLVTLVLAACAAALIFLVWFPDPFADDDRRHGTVPAGGGLRSRARPADLAGDLQQPQVAPRTDHRLLHRRRRADRRAGLRRVHSRRHAPGVRGVQPGPARSRQRARYHAMRNSPPRRSRTTASLPLDGPRFVSIAVPAADQQDALFQSLAGNEEHCGRASTCPTNRSSSRSARTPRPLEELEKKHPEGKPLVDAASAQARDARGARPLVAGSSSQGVLDRADRQRKTASRSLTSTSIRTEPASQW